METPIHSNHQQKTATALHRSVLLASMAFTFLGFMLPIYSKGIGASAVEIGGLYSIFTATVLVGRPVVGWAIDRFGRRRFFITALCFYTLTMVFFAFAGSLTGLYLARMTQGIASSLLWITVRTIVADLSASTERGSGMGKVNEASYRGALIGVFLGLIIYTTLSKVVSQETAWMVTFALYTTLAALGAWNAWTNLPETLPGEVSRPVKRAPIQRKLILLLVVVFTTNLGLALITPVFMIYLQDRFTTNITSLAWAFLPAGILYSFLPSRLGRLSDRFGRAPMMAVGVLFSAVLSICIPTLPGLAWLAVLYSLEAVGWSLADPAETAMVADLVGHEARGRGFGFYELAASLGASAGPLIGGWLYDSISHSAPFYFNGAILLFGAAWVLIFLRPQAPRHPLNTG